MHLVCIDCKIFADRQIQGRLTDSALPCLFPEVNLCIISTMLHAALLKGCVALTLQFDWTRDAGSLSRAELETAIAPALLTLAQRIGKAAQLGHLPITDSVSLVLSIKKARRQSAALEWTMSIMMTQPPYKQAACGCSDCVLGCGEHQ